MSYHLPAFTIKLVRDGSIPYMDRPVCSSPAVGAQIARDLFIGAAREECAIIMTDVKNRVIGTATVGEGTIDRAIVYPRQVAMFLLLKHAAGFILTHNHPSGDPEPSQEDKHLTRSVKEAAQTLEIKMLDHIIVADGNEQYFSFQENRLL